MKVALFGATGVLGAQVLPRLLERGHSVLALVRNGPRRLGLQHPMLATMAGSILDAEACARAVQGTDVVLNLATAIPPPGPQADWAANDRVRREGTAHVLAAAQKHWVPHAVFQSVAMLAHEAGGALLDESSPTTPSPVTQSALELEAMVRGSGQRAVVLRGGVFYGPGTERMALWNGDAAAGRLACPGDGRGYLSLIHVVDMARAVVAAFETRAEGLINIVDDQPVRYRELFDHVARLHGKPPPAPGAPAALPSFNASNARARRVLGWAPAYPSYLSGWQL